MMFPFKTKTPEPEATTPTDVEVIRAKIAACDAAITETEAEFHRLSLSAALSDDDSAAKEAIAKLTELRTRKDLLSNALRAALEVERQNEHRLSKREFQSKRKALQQHLGRFRRAQEVVTAATTSQRDAFREMASVAQSILALMPDPMAEGGFANLLNANRLRSLCEIEATRLSDGGLPAPGIKGGLVSCRDADGNLRTLAQEINELAGNVRTGFDNFGPVQPIPGRPCEVEEVANA